MSLARLYLKYLLELENIRIARQGQDAPPNTKRLLPFFKNVTLLVHLYISISVDNTIWRIIQNNYNNK